MGSLEAALTAIESQNPEESINYSKFARDYNVERSTLRRRHQAISVPRKVKAINQRKLSTQQEQELIRYIKKLTERGLPPTRQMIQNFAACIAKTSVSMYWVDQFIKRHGTDLILKWTAGIDNNRYKADSGAKYSLYFDLLQQKISQYDIEPCNTYNMDEKGFLLGITSRSKRVFSRQMFKSKKIRQAIQDGNREWISLLACICADGSALDPALIYQATSGSVQSSWVEEINPKKHSAFITSSPSGWTNNDIGLAWLKQVFDRCTKAKARRSYRLLIIDGHGSHVTMDFIDYCDRNRILLAIFPPHSTHTLQPLDVVMFKPLSAAYSAELSAFLHRSQGLSSVAKRDFFSLFWAAWEASFDQQLICKAFEATGLSPFNPDAILKRFAQNSLPEQESRESSTSVLSATDWRKIDRLMKAAVNVGGSSEAKKLSRTVHSIAVQKQLLQHENEGLRAALNNEKRRRKRGKPLPFDQINEGGGGAVFWSPSSVQKARERLQQKEADEEQLQLQKKEAAKVRKANNQLKAKLLQERRIARIEAQAARAKAKADQAAERAQKQQARKAQQQLQNRVKLVKTGIKNTSMLATKAVQKKKTAVKAVNATKAAGTTSRPQQPQSRRGRNIKVPSRFL
jgi:hypothetical protein